MSNFIAISRPHLQALIDAAMANSATPADATIILAALKELDSPPVTGAPTSRSVQDCFEAACKESKSFRFPLGIVTLNGAFKNYMDSDTDSAFVGYRAGFVRGLKWHVQAEQANSKVEGSEPSKNTPPLNAGSTESRLACESSANSEPQNRG